MELDNLWKRGRREIEWSYFTVESVKSDSHIICNKRHYVGIMKSAFFVCSSDYEGFSLVLVEAMACGIPCVSTACPNGPLEIIEDGVNGLLSKMDSSDLANKMDWMITHEKERRKMGQNAHRFAARYKKEIVMKKWEDAYLSVTL